jgi:uncharacterized membrane protein
METLSHSVTDALAHYVEAAAAVIIAVAVVASTLSLHELVLPGLKPTPESVRLRLGRWLSLALEFELAADVLGTAITPTWSDIGKLAAIVVIRTAINYFLQKELEQTAAVQ